MSYGPKPWIQLNWDVRAALNFIFGGTGAGFLLLAAFAAAPARAWQGGMLLGLALVGLGLLAVWLEIGRKLRAVHVFFNPFTSWMTRESFVALLLFASGLFAVALASPQLGALTAAIALAFVYCQGRILRASRGIPAWREPTITWLIFLTGIAEGAGLFVALAALTRGTVPALAGGCLALAVVARAVAWSIYRKRVDADLIPKARAALDPAGKLLYQLGTLAPLALLVAGGAFEDFATATDVLAGVAALAAGWRLKYVMVTKASFNQGFSLPRVPVRGRK
ncbi:MAG: DmsC/YnfH family molybdoenzyme membrane anchor subunit [Burkholderiales bacterium]